MEELVFTGHLPLPFGVDLKVNALNKVSGHSRSLRWDSVVAIDTKSGKTSLAGLQQSRHLGFNRSGRQRVYIVVKKETEH